MSIIEDAQKGHITPEMEFVARSENVDSQKIRKLIAAGRLVILKNTHRDTTPIAVGESVSTKINVNIGTSVDFVDAGEEMEKALTAVKYGADTIMDLSTGGDLGAIRKEILNAVSVPVGSVPIYQCCTTDITDITSDDMFDMVRKHAVNGVDFMTVHAGVTINAVEHLKGGGRIMSVVSRGGAFMIAYMTHNDCENPFYAEYDYLLEIAREHDVTLSLGDGMRPGCISDAGDGAMFTECITLGKLVRRSRDAGVQTMVEGPGHMPLNEIESSVRIMKHLADGAPLYLLGPLVTDIAPGYDHITAAIGGSVAGMYGADFLCMVTPSEHLALPTIDDIREGTIVTRIAAHVADLAKIGQKGYAIEWDDKMAYARRDLDWNKQFELAIDPDKARRIHECRKSPSEACSMCGELCAIKIMRDAIGT